MAMGITLAETWRISSRSTIYRRSRAPASGHRVGTRIGIRVAPTNCGGLRRRASGGVKKLAAQRETEIKRKNPDS